MAFSNAVKLDAEKLENVAGGVSFCNYWDGKKHDFYKIGATGGEYTHTFKASDYEAVKAIALATTVPGRSQADDDDAIMEALIASGLLTPIA